MPAVTPTTQPGPPRFITPEEHKQLTASTPISFGDIPPVLRHTQGDVQIVFDPPIHDLGSADKGTLYVIESALAFIWPSGAGFTIEYPRITLHAVSRGEAGPYVYCQLDESDPATGGAEDEDEESEMREMKIIPSDPASVEPIFEALSQCAALHPDPNDAGEDDPDWLDEGENGFSTFDGTNEEELSEVGKAALAHLESLILFPEDEEDEGEEEPTKEALEDAPEETKPSNATPEPSTTLPTSK
ncbi:hypothetical protein FS749_006595 [Ceratobasidium sp. UAMH 11750]|nr:hypothetical protein FS749_006595 [Ceratobasidium sp. UAMH 11750]